MAIYYQKMKPIDIASRVQNLTSLKKSLPENKSLYKEFPMDAHDFKPNLKSDLTKISAANSTTNFAANSTGAKKPVIIYYQSNANNHRKEEFEEKGKRTNQSSPTNELDEHQMKNLIGVRLEFHSQDQVVVGEIFSPSNFFLIKVCSNQSEYDEMENDMKKNYSVDNPNADDKMKLLDHKTRLIGKNQFGATYYQNRWRRIQVQHSDQRTSTCFLVDFGRIVEIETENIYKLMPRFKQLPPKSFRAKLWGIDKQIWSLSDTVFFKNLVADKKLSIELDKDDEAPVIIDVDYYYDCQLSDEDVNISAVIYDQINQ